MIAEPADLVRAVPEGAHQHAVAFIVGARKREKPAGMGMDRNHDIAPRCRPVYGRLHILARPSDEIARRGCSGRAVRQ